MAIPGSSIKMGQEKKQKIAEGKLSDFWFVSYTLSVADPGFPWSDANSKGRNEKLLFGQLVHKNCIKMKEIGPRGEAHTWRPPLDPPMLIIGSTTVKAVSTHQISFSLIQRLGKNSKISR